MAIINGLQDSLDMSYGEVPEQLAMLYDYMKERLLDASKDMDVAAIDEVAKLMITVKSGWDSIPFEEKSAALSKMKGS